MTVTDNRSTTTSEAGPRRSRGLVGLVVIATAVLVLGAVYVAGYLLAGDRTPRNAAVAGVAIGGLSRDEAVTVLAEGLTDRAQAPITLTAADVSEQVDPAAAGLEVDVAGSVDASGAGQSWAPTHIWQVLTGGRDQPPRTTVDPALLDAAVADFAEQADRDAVDATLAYEGVEVALTESVTGVRVDRAQTAQQLQDAFLVSTEVAATTTVSEPTITTEAVEQVAEDVAEPAVSGDVSIDVGEAGSFSVTPEAIATATTFEVAEGTYRASYDAEALLAASEDSMAELDLPQARDASWQLDGETPELVEARDGRSVDAETLLAAVQPVLTESGDARRASVEPVVEQAEFTTADAEKAEVTEVTGEFSTSFPVTGGGEYRNVNLGEVARRIDNTWLAPGETFSMNDLVGERTEANGFVDGYVIQNGVLVKESGGGVSQGATTIFNAAFLAGLEDVEHQPHTLYFDRYPAGREATVYYGTLDLRFKNDTPYGVIVQADRREGRGSQPGELTVKIWSTPVYDEIRSPDAERSNFTDGERVESDDPDCEYQAPIRGFDADYYRAFIKDGEEVKRENYSWRYSPGNEIVCR